MAGKVSGRIKRAISSSLILFCVAGLLAASNAYFQNRDRGLVLGPKSDAQLQFFVDAVDRPDLAAFYKRFRPNEKLKIARNLHQYQNPRLIKVAATWLTDFDPQAREELGKVLMDLSEIYPKEVADELTNGGGFQKIAIFAALRKSFAKTLPYAVAQLANAPARSNAVEYLVGSGTRAGHAVTRMLSDKDRETRLAGADALGKLGFRPAGDKIRELYGAADTADKSPYLAALANIGDPQSETLLKAILADSGSSSQDRSSAILGLGRIGSKASIQALWKELSQAPLDRGAFLEGLSVAGDLSLQTESGSLADRLEVAGGIKSTLADRVIQSSLESPLLTDRAAELSDGRPSLVPALSRKLAALDPSKDGKSIELIVSTLASTDEGLAALKSPSLARFKGFIERERSQPR
ncbi:MAG: hypothetical protein H7Y17_00885 [Chlorobia bacterium]|nr:hypothetical protein [Fimbriimonadaceae bacterium]